MSWGLSMNPFNSHLEKKHSSFFLITVLSIGPDSHYSKAYLHGTNTNIFRDQVEGKTKDNIRAGKNKNKKFPHRNGKYWYFLSSGVGKPELLFNGYSAV